MAVKYKLIVKNAEDERKFRWFVLFHIIPYITKKFSKIKDSMQIKKAAHVRYAIIATDI